MRSTYANGWYQVAFSDELKSGVIKSLYYFGTDLVAYRGEDLSVRVFDAHCPHMGAHLGTAKVIVNSIECPFHGWRFCGQGKCEAVSYAKKIPPKAHLEKYEVAELNGMVFIYYHAQKKAPESFIPLAPEYKSKDWTKYKIFTWKFRSDTEHVIENIADMAHFHFVHETDNIPKWQLKTSLDSFAMYVTANTKLGNKHYPTTIDINILQPGYAIVRAKQTIDMIFFTSVTPIDATQVQHRFAVTVKKDINPLKRILLSPFFMHVIRKQFEEDLKIFEQRKHLSQQMFCDGDGPLGPFKRWYSQFYSDY